ncbi:MAG: hypothetical protein ABIR34_02720 [Marmoricola sp.]
MKLRHEIAYDAPLADVFAMLSDPAFREDSAKASGVISAEVKVKVPRIGAKLESVMADLVTTGRGKEQAAGVAWLGGQR